MNPELAVSQDRGQNLAPGGRGRRRFLRWLLGFSAVSTVAMIAMPVFGFLVPPRSASSAAGGRIPAGTLDDVPLGGGTVVPVGSKPAIVLNTDQGIKAYSAICTHLACVVNWDEAAKTIHCPCHDGRFSPANGSVISGPPPAPLPPLTATVEDGQIFILAD